MVEPTNNSVLFGNQLHSWLETVSNIENHEICGFSSYVRSPEGSKAGSFTIGTGHLSVRKMQLYYPNGPPRKKPALRGANQLVSMVAMWCQLQKTTM